MTLLAMLIPYLPQHEGLLPKWLLFISLVSVANSIQAYTTLSATRKVYPGPKPSASTPKSTPSSSLSPVTPLSARTFGTWTFITSFVRLYTAYNISNPSFYQLGFLTFVVAWGHFMSEWWIFGTTRMGAGLAGPAIVATSSIVWMVQQWGFYVK